MKMLHVWYESTVTLRLTDVGLQEHRLWGIFGKEIFNKAFESCRGM